MSNFSWKTKKEIILENASRDPFLKIEDLAKLANTTSRYVRTILSEADLSLMDLRKEYARKIESSSFKASEKIFLNHLLKVPFKSEDRVSGIDEIIFNSSQDINVLEGNIQDDYLFMSYEHYVSEKPWCLTTIFLSKEAFSQEDGKPSLGHLTTNLNQLLDEGNLEISDIELEIELSAGQIARHLGIPPLSPVLQGKQVIKKNGQCYILILVYFDTRIISFSFSYKNGIIIKRKSIAG
jgi:hypothetical protein